MTDDRSRIWPMAAALTAVFVLGGILGYVVGRPSQSPAAHRALHPGQVRVPNLAGLRLADARKVLTSLGLLSRRGGRDSSTEVPRGIVTSQTPAPGDAIRAPGPIEVHLSAGPGPPPGPTFVFARSVLVRLTHTGPYVWRSEHVALNGSPVSLGANTRVIGPAVVTPYQIAADPSWAGAGMAVSFDVKRLEGPAWFVVIRAFARQREVTFRGPAMSVRPIHGGRRLLLEGHLCRSRPPQWALLSREIVTHIAALDAGFRQVSVYAFRVELKAPRHFGSGHVRYYVRHSKCSATFPIG